MTLRDLIDENVVIRRRKADAAAKEKSPPETSAARPVESGEELLARMRAKFQTTKQDTDARTNARQKAFVKWLSTPGKSPFSHAE